MATVYRKMYTMPLPASAEVFSRDGDGRVLERIHQVSGGYRVPLLLSSGDGGPPTALLKSSATRDATGLS